MQTTFKPGIGNNNKIDFMSKSKGISNLVKEKPLKKEENKENQSKETQV